MMEEIVKFEPYNRSPRLKLVQKEWRSKKAVESIGWRYVDGITDCVNATVVVSDRGPEYGERRYCTHFLAHDDYKSPFLVHGHYDLTLSEALTSMSQRVWENSLNEYEALYPTGGSNGK